MEDLDANPQALPSQDAPHTWDQGLGHTGGMLALVPADKHTSDLQVNGGEDPNQLHMTLAYLGDDMSGLSDEQRDSLYQMTGQLAQTARDGAGQPVGDVFGHAQFNPRDDSSCATYLVNGEGFPELRNSAVRIGQHVLGDGLAPQHPVWVPHITGAYGKTPASLSYTGPVAFDRLRLALGDNVTDYPLGAGPLDETSEPGVSVPTTAAAAQTKIDLSANPQVASELASNIGADVDHSANPGDLSPDAIDQHGGIPVTFPVVVVEGMSTSDGRTIEPGALSHRALPLPVLGQSVNSGEGHKGAEVIGKITELTRVPGPDVVDKETGQPFPEGTFVWSGKGELDTNAHATALAQKGYLTGNSVDLSDMDAEYVLPEMDPDLVAQAEAGDEMAKVKLMDRPEELVVHGGKIAATTLVPIPAFAQAYISIDGQEMTPAALPDRPDDLSKLSDEDFERRFDAAPSDEPDRLGDYLAEGFRRMGYETVTASAWRSGEVGDDCLLCELIASAEETYDADGYELAAAPTADKRARALKKGNALPPAKGQPAGQARYPIENGDDLDKAIRAVGRGSGDHSDIRKYIIRMAKKIGQSNKIPDNWGPDGSLKGVNASAEMEFPPLSDFADPGFTQPTALTVTDDGRVSGHLATWNTCHIGFAGQCIKPPRSSSDYAYFATGAMRARDEQGALRSVAVGHITLGTGHADTSLAAKSAAEHYDNTGAVVADVAAGEDNHGIWISGRVRPGADITTLQACALSGDWRKIGGKLELVATLGVNVPGFPVPRARLASGEPVALVAAGAVRQPDGPPRSAGAVVLDYDQLADALALRLNGRVPIPVPPEEVQAETRDAALADLGMDDASRAQDARRELALMELEEIPFP